MRRIVVNDDWHNVRADRFLASLLPRSLVNKQIRLGRIILNDEKKLSHSDRLISGQSVSIPEQFFLSSSSSKTKVNQSIDIESIRKLILFSNKDLIAIDKPCGMASQGGVGVGARHIGAALFPALREILGDTDLPRIVHRLDRDVSGVLVLARTRRAAASLSAALAAHEWQKQYIALVRGIPSGSSIGSIQNRLLRHGETTPRDAHTDYRVLESHNNISLLSLTPHTGRQHQLRIHCAESLHTPILGDTKYGSSSSLESGEQRLFLHSHRIRLSKEIEIESSIPIEFQERIEKQ
jgi:23S rRNA pseudouridine955/2504/2580 synthase